MLVAQLAAAAQRTAAVFGIVGATQVRLACGCRGLGEAVRPKDCGARIA